MRWIVSKCESLECLNVHSWGSLSSQTIIVSDRRDDRIEGETVERRERKERRATEDRKTTKIDWRG